jgi:peptide/nickel transport system permease protein
MSGDEIMAGARGGKTGTVRAVQPANPHYVSKDPFDANAIEAMTPDQEKVFLASQFTLMWWKFKKHKIAVVCGAFLLFVYTSILVAEFLAPYALETRNARAIYTPPQSVHLFHDGSFVGPFVYGTKAVLDLKTLKRSYTEDTSKVQPIRFFCRGDKYMFWGRSKVTCTCSARRKAAIST